jgi:hypothetical protein
VVRRQGRDTFEVGVRVHRPRRPGAVNEAHGFAVGDALLVAVARRIESLIRDGDVFAPWTATSSRS